MKGDDTRRVREPKALAVRNTLCYVRGSTSDELLGVLPVTSFPSYLDVYPDSSLLSLPAIMTETRSHAEVHDDDGKKIFSFLYLYSASAPVPKPSPVFGLRNGQPVPDHHIHAQSQDAAATLPMPSAR